jgi:hypothetical protein
MPDEALSATDNNAVELNLVMPPAGAKLLRGPIRANFIKLINSLLHLKNKGDLIRNDFDRTIHVTGFFKESVTLTPGTTALTFAHIPIVVPRSENVRLRHTHGNMVFVLPGASHAVPLECSAIWNIVRNDEVSGPAAGSFDFAPPAGPDAFPARAFSSNPYYEHATYDLIPDVIIPASKVGYSLRLRLASPPAANIDFESVRYSHKFIVEPV